MTIAIYITAAIAQPVAGFLRANNLLEISFMLGMALVVLSIITQRIKMRAGWKELGIWLGIAAVYLLLFVRIEIPEERTHLIEYGVLATFIYQALKERMRHGHYIPQPAIFTIVVVALLGLFDEIIQYFIPNRVFDWRDVGFNALAGIIAIMVSLALTWGGKRRKQKNKSNN